MERSVLAVNGESSESRETTATRKMRGGGRGATRPATCRGLAEWRRKRWDYIPAVSFFHTLNASETLQA